MQSALALLLLPRLTAKEPDLSAYLGRPLLNTGPSFAQTQHARERACRRSVNKKVTKRTTQRSAGCVIIFIYSNKEGIIAKEATHREINRSCREPTQYIHIVFWLFTAPPGGGGDLVRSTKSLINLGGRIDIILI